MIQLCEVQVIMLRPNAKARECGRIANWIATEGDNDKLVCSLCKLDIEEHPDLQTITFKSIDYANDRLNTIGHSSWVGYKNSLAAKEAQAVERDV